jgi:hypothetical protein
MYGVVVESFSLLADWIGGSAVALGGVVSVTTADVTREAVFGKLAPPRPSEYPRPKKMPQISTRPKKTPNRDLIPRVISVSVCSSSSIS